MSESAGDDVPRDPWGNPLPPEDRAPAHPTPDDYPPVFPSGPPPSGSAAPSPWPPAPPEQPLQPAPPASPGTGTAPPDAGGAPTTNPAWPGRQEPSSSPPPAPDAAWPGSAPTAGSASYPPPGYPQAGYPPAGYPPAGWAPTPGWAPPRTEGMAIGAFVCSLVGLLCLGIVIEPVALILAVMARKRIRESNGALRGEGFATAALVISVIGIVLAIVSFVLLIQNPDLINDLLDRVTTTTSGD